MDKKDDYFEDLGTRSVAASMRNPDQVLKQEDVDEEMFVFPDRNNPNNGNE